MNDDILIKIKCVNGGLLNDDTLIKTGDTCVNGGLLNDDILIKKSDTCVNGGLLNDDILIKTKWYLCQWWFIEWWYFDKKGDNVSMVVYWMMIFWLKQSDTCVNGGLLNDDTLIKTRWYLCQWWFIEWWYFD